MRVSIVVPCFNEEDVLPITLPVILNELSKIQNDTNQQPFLYLVDDGSTDKTWDIICEACDQHIFVKGIKLSRNFGHQSALLAGLKEAEGDAVISMDADLQDDVEVIHKMLEEFKKGSEIVYAVRDDRGTDSAFKRQTAMLFYKFMSVLGTDIVYNHADYRLLSRKAIEQLHNFEEVNLFLRGIIPLLGFKSSKVTYKRGTRAAGESKYPMRKMLALAIDGITSFSVRPLRFVAVIGMLFAFAAMIQLGWIFYVKFGLESAVPGWASTLIPITFFGGVQLFCLGLVGEYIGKIYNETKKRPLFIIEKLKDKSLETTSNNQNKPKD
jgi:glycosyltransferase involved in cell wall biosynthesis